MLKQHIKTATPYLLSVLLFCLIAWIVDSSQLFQSCVSEGKHNAGDETLQNKVSVFVSEFWVYRRCLGIYVIERNAGITALFTVVLAVSTILLWIVTNKAAKAAQAAAEHIPIVEGAFAAILLNGTLVYSDIWECQWDGPFNGRYDAETENFRIDNYTQQRRRAPLQAAIAPIWWGFFIVPGSDGPVTPKKSRKRLFPCAGDLLPMSSPG